jgi:hypothetical protein
MTQNEDLATIALLEFLNACEAGIAAAKNVIKENKLGSTEPSWNPDKIKWATAEGSAGPYERSEDINNLGFKTLLKDLTAHQGKLTREGYFYWSFRNGYTVGRKKRQSGETTSE